MFHPNAADEMTIVESVRTETGLYALKEAATYARLHPRTLQRWHFGSQNAKPLQESLIPPQEGKFLTFLEFVEALAIRTLRIERKIPLQRIREAVEIAKSKYQIDHPFAQEKHKTFTLGKHIHILLDGESMVGLSGEDRSQTSFRPVLETYMQDLTFDDRHLAKEYTAYRAAVGVRIVEIRMNPQIQFGEPMVGDTGHSAHTLWMAANAEGSIEKASQYYEVSPQEVRVACQYWESLGMAA
jgi:uncharacterized protein (DUF433 family)